MLSVTISSVVVQLAILSFAIPVFVAAIWKTRHHKSLGPIFTGAFVFIVFALILETVPHLFFLQMKNPVSAAINKYPFCYALYAGLVAGVFEETGRLLAFRYMMYKHRYKESAITYGIGHGGIEMMLVFGFAMIQDYIYMTIINAGQTQELLDSLGSDAERSMMQGVLEEIGNLTISDCLIGGLERIFAFSLQIALSVLVYYAIHEVRKVHWFWIAVGLHALADFPVGLYQKGVLSLPVTEILFIVVTVAVCVVAFKLYHMMPEEKYATGESSGKEKVKEVVRMPSESGHTVADFAKMDIADIASPVKETEAGKEDLQQDETQKEE